MTAFWKEQAEQALLEASDLQERAALSTFIERADQYLNDNKATYNMWKEGGIGRAFLQAGVGALMTGDMSGAAAGGASSLSAPYLNAAGEQSGSLGQVLLNTLGGAAIGYVAGGSSGAVVGANVDWHNRQLHDSEIRKIKNIAKGFAAEQNISEEQAVDRLMAQAMRQVDKAYAEIYARDDTSAQTYLRKHTGSFVADGRQFTEFANMGYYTDSTKFAEQTGYATERNRLYRQPIYTRSQKNAEINALVRQTIGQGIGKGVANTPGSFLNSGADWINQFTHGKLGTIPNVPNIFDYNNKVEAAIGNQTGNAVIGVGGIVTGVKTGGRANITQPETFKLNPIAGSIRNINPGYPAAGRINNCVNCAIATDNLLAGRPTSALPSLAPVKIDTLERMYRSKFSQATTIQNITISMSQAGNGARGIVFGSRGEQTGHVFNVVNQNGVIRFLDGQTGKPANFNDGYTSFHLLRTNQTGGK
ncbi:hypothetical protein L1281_002567 [Neisseria sp. HSC-16F19]|nr:toxin glutamine deamidase domain-containing protein [Neisseria sp. HSC-16F19]MCP2041949.1 hypothetical protein [Neisseria sp. HSC-16F19]